MSVNLSLLRSSLAATVREESYQKDIFHKYILFSYYRSLIKQYGGDLIIWCIVHQEENIWDNESFKLPEKCIECDLHWENKI